MVIDLRYDPRYGALTTEFFDFRAELSEINNIDPRLLRPTNGATGALGAVFSSRRMQDVRQGKPSSALMASLEYFDAHRMLVLYGFDVQKVPNPSIEYPVAEVIDALQGEPSILYLSVPNNPTGKLLPEEELDRILYHASSETRVVIDRTLVHPQEYCRMDLLGKRHSGKDIVIVDSFSKSLGLIKERVGYFMANREETIVGIHPFAHAPNSIAMNCVRELLPIQEELLKEVTARHDQSNELLRKWGESQSTVVYHPSISNVALIELLEMSGEGCRSELEKRDILLRSGKDLFIGPRYIRINLGQPEKIPEFLDAMDSILAGSE